MGTGSREGGATQGAVKINLIAVGTRMPGWVTAGYEEYAKRMPPECQLNLIEIVPGQRGRKMDTARALKAEAEKMLASIPQGSKVIALDVEGQHWSTDKLSGQVSSWMQDGRDVALLIGGPEGLHSSCLALAEQRWSLSALTFPHPLVRVLLAEQLYRAISILKNHPYHRG